MRQDFTQAALSQEGLTKKAHTRLSPLDLVREHSSFLWTRTGQHLRHDWMELASHQAPTLQLLMDEGAINVGGGKFVGVDLSQAVIDGCRAHYPKAHAEWHAGRIESLVSQRGAHPNVGVLIYDSEEGVWRGRWDALNRVCAYARAQAEALGEFLLVVNVVADPRFSGPKEIGRYLERISEQVGTEVNEGSLHRYRSNVQPMLWTAIRFGF